MSGELLEALVEISRKANRLAKTLTGTDRKDAYRLKAFVCGLMIIKGAATVNGVRNEDIVGLDIVGCRSRIHIRISHLQPAAQRATLRLRASAPAVISLKESLARMIRSDPAFNGA